MSDEEEISEGEEAPDQASKTEAVQPDFVKRAQQKRGALDEELNVYIEEWRKQRRREEEELQKLKDKQAKRKVIREQQEKAMEARRQREEKERQAAVEEKKKKEQEEKMKRLQEIERKRQEKRDKGGSGGGIGGGGASSAEFHKTKEQLEEEKKISLSFRIKPMNLDGKSLSELKAKANELWEALVKLETEKYDLEERQKRQDYDLKELQERKKQQLRQKALKLGLEPEALTGKYPPKIRLASKFERRVDTRTYEEKKSLFEGGYDKITKEIHEKVWCDKTQEFKARPKARLPKWFGERPGKKKDDPPTPEDEEEQKAGAGPIALDLEPDFLDDEEPVAEEAAPPEPEAAEEEEAEEEEEEEEEEESEEEEE